MASRGDMYTARMEKPSGIGYDPEWWRVSLSEVNHIYKLHGTPETAIQALMEADFMEEPRASVEELEARRVAFFELCNEIVTPTEMAVLEMLFIGGHSTAQVGLLLARGNGRSRSYSKTWVAKLRDSGLCKLRERLDPNVLVQLMEDGANEMDVEDGQY